MERKKAILVAAAVNAALLLTLFIASLTTGDLIPEVAVEREVRSPAFMESTPSTLVYQPKESISIPVSPIQEEPVLHVLPPVAVSLPPVVQEAVPPTFVQAPVTAREPTLQEVTVQKGDSLDRIAKKHNKTVDALLKCNQLSGTFLKVGQKLKIPPPVNKTVAAPAFTPEGAEYYTMKVGDNPWSIAMKHHLKVDELLKLNGLNEEKARKLKPGDRLRIR